MEGGSTGLTSLTTVTTYLWTQFTEVATTISETPILMIGLGVFVIGSAIGLAKRLISA